MDDLADLADLFFEDAVGRGVSNHDRGEDVCVLRGLFAEIFDVDVAELVTAYAHNFHGGHLGGGGIGAMRGGGNETDVAVRLAAAAMVSADGKQARVLALRPGVRL